MRASRTTHSNACARTPSEIPDHAPVERVRAAVREALDRRLFAVSGGMFSMVLLDACAAVAPERIAAVATFDHGTGPAAHQAVAHVRGEAAARALCVIAGRAERSDDASEAAWRVARWRFLRAAAREAAAEVVATGHARDDQVETVALRALRDSGPRGLAGLLAGGADVVRPLLDVDRSTIAAYAAARSLRWVEDPSNRSARHLRNRVRHELLPALRAVRPRSTPSCSRWGAARRSGGATWSGSSTVHPRAGRPGRRIDRCHSDLLQYDADALAVLWPAIAARAGVRLDRRGTVRLVQFTISIAAGAAVGAEIELSGSVEVVAGRGEVVLRPRRPRAIVASEAVDAVPLVHDLVVGSWQLRAGRSETDSAWTRISRVTGRWQFAPGARPTGCGVRGQGGTSCETVLRVTRTYPAREPGRLAGGARGRRDRLDSWSAPQRRGNRTVRPTGGTLSLCERRIDTR